MLAKELSKAIDHLDGTNLLLLLATTCKLIIKKNTKIQYKAKLVNVKFKYPKIGAFKPIKLVTSNCYKGELIIIKFERFIYLYYTHLGVVSYYLPYFIRT